jgi:hypothetical protein
MEINPGLISTPWEINPGLISESRSPTAAAERTRPWSLTASR